MITTTASTRINRARSRLPEMTAAARLLQRIRAEFVEMPGLILTLPQATRLWCLTAPQATAALTELVDDGFLMRDPRGVYRRRGSCPRCS
jgi:Fic family protein